MYYDFIADATEVNPRAYTGTHYTKFANTLNDVLRAIATELLEGMVFVRRVNHERELHATLYFKNGRYYVDGERYCYNGNGAFLEWYEYRN